MPGAEGRCDFVLAQERREWNERNHRVRAVGWNRTHTNITWTEHHCSQTLSFLSHTSIPSSSQLVAAGVCAYPHGDPQLNSIFVQSQSCGCRCHSRSVPLPAPRCNSHTGAPCTGTAPWNAALRSCSTSPACSHPCRNSCLQGSPGTKGKFGARF